MSSMQIIQRCLSSSSDYTVVLFCFGAFGFRFFLRCCCSSFYVFIGWCRLRSLTSSLYRFYLQFCEHWQVTQKKVSENVWTLQRSYYIYLISFLKRVKVQLLAVLFLQNIHFKYLTGISINQIIIWMLQYVQWVTLYRPALFINEKAF